MRENVIVDKSYAFAVNIVKLCLELQKSTKEYVITGQLLKSGTSIGANIHEAQGSISKPEFIAKIQISLKEAKETKYWLTLMKDADLCHSDLSYKLLNEVGQIITILVSILKTSKSGK